MKLKCAGAVSGAVEVSEEATVGDLFRELEKLAGTAAGSLKVIARGRKITADEAALLSHLGLTAASTRLVVSRVGPNPASYDAQTARLARLDRIQKAAEAIAKRSGGGSRRAFALETQEGSALQGVSEADRKALTAGLALHQKGRQLMDGAGADDVEGLTDALDVLLLAEEAFGVASSDLTSRVDNVAILLLDAVWVMFRLRDATKLATACSRLRTCREGFSRAHGPNLERLRTLQGGFAPEMGLYVRLELLEGVAAYHGGDWEVARSKLTAARDRWKSLQLSDDSLAALAGMGFGESEATRGLRFCGGDVAKAAAFIVDQRARAVSAADAARARAKSEQERRRFGLTERGNLVDEDALKALEDMGYCRQLAAAALRATENAVQAALDALATPFGKEALEDAAMSAAEDWDKEKTRRRTNRGAAGGGGSDEGGRHRSKKRAKAGQAEGSGGEGGGGGVGGAAEVTLVEMGFEVAAVRRALSRSNGDVDSAAALLVEGGGGENEVDVLGAAGHGGDTNEQEEEEEDESDSSGDEDEEQDEEMEADLFDGLASGDALKEYDIELGLEGQAISEFLTLVTQADSVEPGSA